jgi:hypothetical protein
MPRSFSHFAAFVVATAITLPSCSAGSPGAATPGVAGSLNRHRQAGPGWMTSAAVKGPVVYVASALNDVVNVYSAKTLAPVGQITAGLEEPLGLATDSAGNLYVTNEAAHNVTVYAPGSKKPKATLGDTDFPTAVAVAKNGTVYVAVRSGVDVFRKGARSRSYTIYDSALPSVIGVAVDSHGDVFASGVNPKEVGEILEFAPGSKGNGRNLHIKGPTEGQIAIDASDNLIVADFSHVAAYKSGSQLPFALNNSTPGAYYIALDQTQTHLYSPVFWSGGPIYAYDYPTLANSTSFPASSSTTLTGVAVSPATTH